jgi:hypothetical protein
MFLFLINFVFSYFPLPAWSLGGKSFEMACNIYFFYISLALRGHLACNICVACVIFVWVRGGGVLMYMQMHM